MDSRLAAAGRWLPEEAAAGDGELAALAGLHRAGLAVTAIIRVPAEAQEQFYRYGNLVGRLSRLFRDVDPDDPDEDDLEELAPEAMALITGSYLLDETVDTFYDSVGWLPPARRIRRPGGPGIEASGDRASLLALKRTWAEDWSFESLAARLRAAGSFRLEASPVLVHEADRPTDDRRLLAQVERLLGRPVAVHVTPDGSISRLG